MGNYEKLVLCFRPPVDDEMGLTKWEQFWQSLSNKAFFGVIDSRLVESELQGRAARGDNSDSDSESFGACWLFENLRALKGVPALILTLAGDQALQALVIFFYLHFFRESTNSL